MNDFSRFADLLKQVGFEKVLSQRQSKVQKFRHPDFKKGCENLQYVAKEIAELKRKIKMSEEENLELSAAGSMKKKNQERNPEQKAKR